MKTIFRAAALGLAAMLQAACSGSPAAEGAANLAPLLEQYRQRHALPALAAAVVRDGRPVALGATGTRRAGEDVPVMPDDRFHLGSNTKPMTALLAAMLVEEGKLRWDSTVGEVLPELTPPDARWRAITLEQLLSHTGGLPAEDASLWELVLESQTTDDGGNELVNLDEMRHWLIRQWSQRPLASRPGAAFAYRNMGYVLAGVMLERASGMSWEELISARIFDPLGLRTAGLGMQASLGRIDAPLGHELVDGRIKAFLGGPSADNPAVLGPAGAVHMSLPDFARWGGWMAGQALRPPFLVRPETMAKIFIPAMDMPGGGKTALGWGVRTFDWAPAPLAVHAGSNGKNLAHILIDRGSDAAIVLVTNIATADADAALTALAPVLYREFVRAKP